MLVFEQSIPKSILVLIPQHFISVMHCQDAQNKTCQINSTADLLMWAQEC